MWSWTYGPTVGAYDLLFDGQPAGLVQVDDRGRFGSCGPVGLDAFVLMLNHPEKVFAITDRKLCRLCGANEPMPGRRVCRDCAIEMQDHSTEDEREDDDGDL